MPDFPGQAYAVPKPIVSTFGPQCPHGSTLIKFNLNTTFNAWPAANRALYTAVHLETPFQVQKALVVVGTQSGNLDIGIYDEWGNRIVSKGSTAVGAAGNQIIDLSASVTGTASPVLKPGTYWWALNVDNTTATIKGSVAASIPMLMAGCVQQQAVGAVTLPSTAAFANPASIYIPYILMSSNSVL